MYPRLFTPGRIGTLVLPHRILMGAMHTGLDGEGGDPERARRFYVERVRGGAALVITGGVAVSPEGGGTGYAVLTRPRDREELARLADEVHRAGGRIALQLFHAGRYTTSAETGLEPVAPSAVPSRVHREMPRALRAEEIRELVEAFAEGAAFAREAGYDAVEVMGSEGYLINQFLSPLTNRRDDAYGGDARRRMRFALEVVEAIRRRTGRDYPVVFRMSGLDLMPGSSTWEETLELARALVRAGVDALNVGIGWHESSVPTVGMAVPRGAFAWVGEAIRREVTVPVIVSNRINTPEVAEWVLQAGAADFVALARPFLADPAFVNKAREGRREAINVCIACNQRCLDRVLGRPPAPVTCLVNPAAAREEEFAIRPAARSLRVAVVGAGPAGLEAARVLAARGHRVDLWERDRRIGGQLNLAVRIPGKEEFAETLRYYRHALAELGVVVRVGRAPEVKELQAYDAVVVATGVRPRVPDIPGVHLPHVVGYREVLTGAAQVGQRVVILGAGGIGCDVAHFLSSLGSATPAVAAFLAHYQVKEAAESLLLLHGRRHITLVRRGDRIGQGLGPTTRWVLLQELRRRGVQMLTGVAYREIVPEGVRVAHEGREVLLPADTVILCTGQEPEASLVEPLQQRGVRTLVVGGAREARELDAARAIEEGARAGLSLE